jgi:hypothetical protein
MGVTRGFYGRVTERRHLDEVRRPVPKKNKAIPLTDSEIEHTLEYLSQKIQVISANMTVQNETPACRQSSGLIKAVWLVYALDLNWETLALQR